MPDTYFLGSEQIQTLSADEWHVWQLGIIHTDSLCRHAALQIINLFPGWDTSPIEPLLCVSRLCQDTWLHSWGSLATCRFTMTARGAVSISWTCSCSEELMKSLQWLFLIALDFRVHAYTGGADWRPVDYSCLADHSYSMRRATRLLVVDQHSTGWTLGGWKPAYDSLSSFLFVLVPSLLWIPSSEKAWISLIDPQVGCQFDPCLE